MTALLDTNVLFATASARDQHHDDARAIVRGIDHGDLSTGVVTNYVLAEVLNLVREKLSPATANDVLDRLAEGQHFEVLHAARDDFDAAKGVFRQYPELSFVDATVVAYMDRAGIEYLYSFDDDFDVVDGITRLVTPDDPRE